MDKGLLIGAYERDNFGDILFLLASRSFLGEGAFATAPFGGDTSPFGGERVEPYLDLISSASLGYVWVVGGEIGGTTVASAAQMSGASIQPQLPEYASPYMPRLSRFDGALGLPYVINSAGVSALALATGSRRTEGLAALREATFISVRDLESSRFLTRHGVPHVLAPDVVHTIGRWGRASPDASEDYTLVQISEDELRRIGVSEFADSLAVSVPSEFVLRLFLAGEAPGHDSRQLMVQLADRYRARTRRPVELSSALSAQDKALEIASARLWIGTSLHGFILSTAYAVPRVGLTIQKVAQYARTWNIDMPVAVQPEQLRGAVAAAMRPGRGNEMRKTAALLEDLSAKNVENAMRSIGEADPRLLREERLQSREHTDLALARTARLSRIVDPVRVLAARARRRIHRVR